MSDKLTGYEASRQWFDFAFENPDLITSNHGMVYFFALEHQNRMGGAYKFGLPTSMVMTAVGIKSYNTYIKAFKDLVKWGFITLIKKSENQYSSNIIAISKIDISLDKSLDKALMNHRRNHLHITGEITSSINKQVNKETSKQINKEGLEVMSKIPFDTFWNLYDKKDNRKGCSKKWDRLDINVQEKILKHVKEYVLSTPDKKYRKNPETYLNQEAWENEIINKNKTGNNQSSRHASTPAF